MSQFQAVTPVCHFPSLIIGLYSWFLVIVRWNISCKFMTHFLIFNTNFDEFGNVYYTYMRPSAKSALSGEKYREGRILGQGRLLRQIRYFQRNEPCYLSQSFQLVCPLFGLYLSFVYKQKHVLWHAARAETSMMSCPLCVRSCSTYKIVPQKSTKYCTMQSIFPYISPFNIVQITLLRIITSLP